jgi:hypothetical protein
MNKADSNFCLRWAKKIMAINLLGGKCCECGNHDIFVLEFHHDNKDKESDIHGLNLKRWSIMKKEVLKCKLLCRNCHFQKHGFGTERNLRLKQKLLDIKGVHKCEKCDYSPDKLSVLAFHHLREKKLNLNVIDIRFAGISWEDIILEMDKCRVLCHNCHITEHIGVDTFNRLKSHIDYKVKHHKELRPALDKDVIRDMYFNKNMRQIDIVRHFKCSKGTISGIIKKLIMPFESGLRVTE